jgi:hypothetical protein
MALHRLGLDCPFHVAKQNASLLDVDLAYEVQQSVSVHALAEICARGEGGLVPRP